MKEINRYLVFVLVTVCILLPQISFSQLRSVRFEELDSLQKEEKRPVVVFLHTSWCKYCGSMKSTTFKNSQVVKILNQKFYFVSFDAEGKADIPFRGYTFKYKPTDGVHELAAQLGMINGQISYPSICFLNPDYEIIFQKGGYIPAKDLLPVLTQLNVP